MNIFVLDYHIPSCAHYHCDKHVVKMVLEYAQLLSTAVRLSGIEAGYFPTHSKHPCAQWARASVENWLWLRELATCLNDEYRYRYDKVDNHAAYDVILQLPVPPLPSVGLTPHAQAMPIQYQHPCAVTAYRDYYYYEKASLLEYTRRVRPYWTY